MIDYWARAFAYLAMASVMFHEIDFISNPDPDWLNGLLGISFLIASLISIFKAGRTP